MKTKPRPEKLPVPLPRTKALEAVIVRLADTLRFCRRNLNPDDNGLTRIREALQLAGALVLEVHHPSCEVRRWAGKPDFGPPARCGCRALLEDDEVTL